MATATINGGNAFPQGTVVTVYPARSRIPGQPPSGTSVTSGTIDSDGRVTLIGLSEPAEYVAYAQVNGENRYVAFAMPPPVINPGGLEGPAGGVLSGSYPDPGFAVDMATQAELDAVLALGGIQPSVVDAKGDLIAATAADTVSRLGVGSNGQVLTADSTQATGLKWGTASATAANALTVYNVRDATYGAVGNGSTDDTSTIQAAIDAATAAGGGIVYLPPGSYRVATGLLGKSNVQIVGAGKNLTVLLLDDVASIGVGLNAGASATASPLLATDLAKGSASVTVASTTGLSVGETVLIKAAQVSFGAWMPKIIDITGTTLTFDETSPLPFTVADSSQLFRYAMMSNFRLAHLSVRTNTATPVNRKVLVQVDRSINVMVDNCDLSNAGSISAKAVYATTSRNVRVLHCDVDNVKADDTALSINADRVTKFSAIDNNLRNVSAGIVVGASPQSTIHSNRITGAGTASGGRGIKLMDGSDHSSVIGNTVADFATDHTAIRIADNAYSVISGNVIRSCGTGVDMNTDTSPNRPLTKHNVISDNVILDCTGWGVDHEPNGATTTDMFNVIRGNRIHNCSLGGVSVGTCGNVISGNVITDYGTGTGIRVQSSSNQRNLIQGNYIRNPSTPGSGLATWTVGNNTVLDNDTGTEKSTLAASDVHRSVPRVQVVTYSASMVIDPSSADNFKTTVTDAVAHAFAAPLGGNTAGTGHRITIDVLNGTAGSIATASWSGAFKLAGAWVPPLAGKHRLITFMYDGANWLETARSAADV